MTEREALSQQFEASRGHLRGVAYRMLGSLSEADDAVQEAWLRLSRTDAREVENLRGWLTTVIARVCLDMLRSRKARREEALEVDAGEPVAKRSERPPDPEQEAALADSVGLALLVVLDTLGPAERLAFVLHEMFGVSFEEIARIVNRSPAAARQLASRARRRVRGAPAGEAKLRAQRKVVDAFLAALRAGDFEALLDVLDPEVIVRTDRSLVPSGAPTEIRGARTWAQSAVVFGRMATAVRPALVNGNVGVIFAPKGNLARALNFTIVDGTITEIEIVADADRLSALEISVVD